MGAGNCRTIHCHGYLGIVGIVTCSGSRDVVGTVVIGIGDLGSRRLFLLFLEDQLYCQVTGTVSVVRA